ncbi:MAG: class I SAM-dependent methyltransferase [Anaerolineae bacterium]|nr:class I SAM-dependent methyltransferase [Anaerolineae bacterium]
MEPTMNLLDIVQRDPQPGPWAEGDNIPWHEPGFSQRMLREHFNQAHDAASRRTPTIDAQVHWIHTHVLRGQPGRILDLGCGPGLYAGRFARLGHTCLGIDYSPASIAYARQEAEREGLSCRYVLQDLRQADYGAGHDLAMLIYGEFNIFRPGDMRAILGKAHRALKEGGLLLLEPHTLDAVREQGQGPATWYASSSGLFSERPHLCLTERHWDDESQTATVRHYVVDAASGDVTRYAQTFQGYTDEAYTAILQECGFSGVVFHPSLRGIDDPNQPGLLAIVARKVAG